MDDFDRSLARLGDVDPVDPMDLPSALFAAVQAGAKWAREQPDPLDGVDQALERLARASAPWAVDGAWTRLRWAQSALQASFQGAASPSHFGLGAPSWKGWAKAGLPTLPWVDPQGSGFVSAEAGLGERSTVASRCLAAGNPKGAREWLKLSNALEAFAAEKLPAALWSGLASCASRSDAKAWLALVKGRLDPMGMWKGADGQPRCVWDPIEFLAGAGMGLGPAMEVASWGGSELLSLSSRLGGPTGLSLLAQYPDLLARWEAGRIGASSKKPRSHASAKARL
jgi:hypothetical protein